MTFDLPCVVSGVALVGFLSFLLLSASLAPSTRATPSGGLVAASGPRCAIIPLVIVVGGATGRF